MRLIIIAILTIFNLACNHIEIPHLERCGVSFTFNKCRCHMYDVHNMERVGVAYDMPLEYCENFVGFHADDWALELTPKLRKLMEYAKKYQDNQCR